MTDWYRLGAAAFAGLVIILLVFAIFAGRQSLDSSSAKVDAVGAGTANADLQKAVADVGAAVDKANTTLTQIAGKLPSEPSNLGPTLDSIDAAVGKANQALTRIEGKLPAQTPDLAAAIDGLNTAIGKTDAALAKIDGKLPADLGKTIDGLNAAVGNANHGADRGSRANCPSGRAVASAQLSQALTRPSERPMRH